METEAPQPVTTKQSTENSQPSMLTQPFAPKIFHQDVTTNSKPYASRTTTPLSSRISYDVSKLLERKADINVKDLLVVAPVVKRNLIKATKTNTSTKSNNELSLNFFEDDDVDTTAIYTEFFINDTRIKTMLDTGSAKTCMSKEIADKLGLSIDAPSTSIFTLGNGSKQASLGIVYDVPLNLGGSIRIPVLCQDTS
jgi:hypothetical protein